MPAMEHARGWCPECERHVRADRKAVDHRAFGLLTVLTCGLALPLWLLMVPLHHLTTSYRCQVCHSKVRAGAAGASDWPW